MGKYHQRISARYVQLLVQRLRNKAGIDIPASPHSFRHAFTSRVAEKTGGNVLILKELLGHRRFETVQIYAHVSRAQLAEAVGLIAQ